MPCSPGRRTARHSHWFFRRYRSLRASSSSNLALLSSFNSPELYRLLLCFIQFRYSPRSVSSYFDGFRRLASMKAFTSHHLAFQSSSCVIFPCEFVWQPLPLSVHWELSGRFRLFVLASKISKNYLNRQVFGQKPDLSAYILLPKENKYRKGGYESRIFFVTLPANYKLLRTG